jgi:hypothetical protein
MIQVVTQIQFDKEVDFQYRRDDTTQCRGHTRMTQG